MSKETNIETIVLEANLDTCTQIRRELIEKFEFIWVMVYQTTAQSIRATITVSNAFGGKLEKEKADEVIEYAQNIYDKFKS